VSGSEAALRDIADRDDISVLVRSFYEAAFDDALLGPIFTEIAHMDLDAHMPIMCDFWQTVLFRAGLYQRNALALHVALHERAHLEQRHFDRWLVLWNATVSRLYAGEKAELAKLQAARIAGSIHRRLQGESGSDFVSIHRRPTV
jgi:hemoglobin